MSSPRLILHPANPAHTVSDVTRLISAMQDAGLMADNLTAERYRAGKSFVELVVFLGCSPNISLHPQESDSYCYIEIPPPQANSTCLGYTLSAVPRCPQCKTKLPHWQQIDNWMSGTTLCHCPQCNTATPMQDLKWRQECAWGRCGISIYNIHPFEAVPSEQLLQRLQSHSGFEWHYSYANNQKVPRNTIEKRNERSHF